MVNSTTKVSQGTIVEPHIWERWVAMVTEEEPSSEEKLRQARELGEKKGVVWGNW